MEKFLAVADTINLVVKWLLALILVVMTILIGWQVFARFIVGESLAFSEEVSRFLMVWLVILGAAYAARHGRLIKVDLLEHFLHGKLKTIAISTAAIISIVFYVILVFFGFFIVSAVSYQLSPATQLSMSIPMAALPVGGIFLIISTLAQVCSQILGYKNESEIDELVAEAKEDHERAINTNPESTIEADSKINPKSTDGSKA